MFDIQALYEAESPAHAAALLAEHPSAVLIAGGTDVLIRVREGRMPGATLVSIRRLDCLRGIALDDDGLRVGPLTTFTRLIDDPLIRRCLPTLAEAAETVGGPQLRAVATVGGNLCNGATSADSASTLLAFDAVLDCLSPRGARSLPLAGFYLGPGRVALDRDELVTAIRVPRDSWERCAGRYLKYAMREALDIATLGCSANVRLTADGAVIERLRLAYGVAGPVPLRAPHAEAAARGRSAAPGDAAATAAAAAEAALADLSPRTSWRATREFRLRLARELAVRAITGSIARARAFQEG